MVNGTLDCAITGRIVEVGESHQAPMRTAVLVVCLRAEAAVLSLIREQRPSAFRAPDRVPRPACPERIPRFAHEINEGAIPNRWLVRFQKPVEYG
jgi:hypothetical protein